MGTIGKAATGNGLIGFNRIGADGTDRIDLLTSLNKGDQIDVEINGTVHTGTITRRSENKHGEVAFGTTASVPRSCHRGSFKLFLGRGQDRIYKRFKNGEFSPAVEAELVELCDYSQPDRKRRRLTL